MTYIEKCLYEYLENLEKLSNFHLEQKKLMSVHGQSYEKHSANGISDPVSEVAFRFFSLEKKILKTEKKITPVTELYKSLLWSSELHIFQMKEILKLRYFEKKKAERVIREMAISRATFWRRCHQLLSRAKKYFYPEY